MQMALATHLTQRIEGPIYPAQISLELQVCCHKSRCHLRSQAPVAEQVVQGSLMVDVEEVREGMAVGVVVLVVDRMGISLLRQKGYCSLVGWETTPPTVVDSILRYCSSEVQAGEAEPEGGQPHAMREATEAV